MKQIYMLLLCLCFAVLCVSMVSAQEGTDKAVDPNMVSEEMIGILTANLDNLFPLNSQKYNFMTPAEALYSDVGTQTVVRKKTGEGKRNILLIANADGVHEYLAYDTIDTAYPNDFMLTMDVTAADVYPDKQGGCFVGFTNLGVSAFSAAEGAVAVSAVIDGKTVQIYVKEPDADAGTHISLGDLARQSSKLSIIHLTGHTYVYINGKFMGQYHDGIRGGLRMIYGSAVFTEGDTAECTFDNLLIRTVSVQ